MLKIMIVKQCRGGHRAELQLQIDIGPVCRDGYHVRSSIMKARVQVQASGK